MAQAQFQHVTIVSRMNKKIGPKDLHPPPFAKEGNKITMPHRKGKEKAHTFLVHLEYTMYMRGVDVADQLRGATQYL